LYARRLALHFAEVRWPRGIVDALCLIARSHLQQRIEHACVLIHRGVRVANLRKAIWHR
jgi:hypothetical protein